jgi:hypothetical protein
MESRASIERFKQLYGPRLAISNGSIRIITTEPPAPLPIHSHVGLLTLRSTDKGVASLKQQ